MEPNEPIETPDPAEIAEQDKQDLKREVIDFVKLVVWFLVIFLSLKFFVLEGYEVQGESMEPNLYTNERILVLKLPHELSKIISAIDAFEPGDIIVFDSPDTPGKRYVKRVIAMGPKSDGSKTVDAETEAGTANGSEVLVLFDHGKVYVNNRIIEEKYLSEDNRTSSDKQELTLGSDEIYVLGDNRKVSKDSRNFKAIHDDAIIGKAVLRFWPPSRISFLN